MASCRCKFHCPIIKINNTNEESPSSTQRSEPGPSRITDELSRSKEYHSKLDSISRQSRKDKVKEFQIRSKDKRGQPPAKKAKAENLGDDKIKDSNAGEVDGKVKDSDACNEDDTAAHMEELEIEKERAAGAERKDSEENVEEELIWTENVLSGNPLLNHTTSSSLPQSPSPMDPPESSETFGPIGRITRSSALKEKGGSNDSALQPRPLAIVPGSIQAPDIPDENTPQRKQKRRRKITTARAPRETPIRDCGKSACRDAKADLLKLKNDNMELWKLFDVQTSRLEALEIQSRKFQEHLAICTMIPKSYATVKVQTTANDI